MEKTLEDLLPEDVVEAIRQYVLEAHADLQQFDSQFMDQVASAGDWQTLIALLEMSLIRRFDLCAEQLLFTSITPNQTVSNPLYERYLYRVLDEKFTPYISQCLAPLRADIRDDFISRINLRLRSRILHWLAESKRRLLSLRRSGTRMTPKKNQSGELSRVIRLKRPARVSDTHGTAKMSRQAKLTQEEEVALESKLKNPSVYKLLSVKEAAVVLKKSIPTIYRYINDGKLTCPEGISGRIHTKSLLRLSHAPKRKHR